MTPKEAVSEFQCSGCSNGPALTCFKEDNFGEGCGGHGAGTMASGIGSFFLGLPKGFNRIGGYRGMRPQVYNKLSEFGYNKFNVPVWKARDEEHSVFFVRGLTPRLNDAFIHIYLDPSEFDQVDALDVTEDIKEMD